MAITIGSNISALKAQRRLNTASALISASCERLASGMRINKAADDAAGLAIASDLRTSSRVFTQAVRNVNDGLSALSLEEGALDQLTSILLRQRELAEQAANGTYSFRQRAAMHQEADKLVAEFNRIVASASFNGRELMTQAASDLRIQCGYGVEGSVSFALADALARTVGTGAFGSRSIYGMETDISYAVHLADIDSDGRLDLITAGDTTVFPGTASVRLGNGNGTFLAKTSYAMETSDPRNIETADLNGDGILDLVTAGRTMTNSGSACIRLGNGNGTFLDRRIYAMETQVTYAVELGDFNEDGRLDLITAGGTTGRSTIRLGNGDGTFGARRSFVMDVSGTLALDAADVNNDGFLDVATAGQNASGGGATIRLGNGDGTFKASLAYATETTSSWAVGLEDLNGDGWVDLVTAGDKAGAGAATIRLGCGDGTFGAARSYATEATLSYALQLEDVDGDGVSDLVTGGSGGSKSTIRLGNGDGTFKAGTGYQMDITVTRAVDVGDIDGDGAPDLVTAGDSGAGSASIRLAVTRRVTTMPKLWLYSREQALREMAVIDDALDRVALERGGIGAIQSRLMAAGAMVGAARENFDAAAGRLADADVAEESSHLVRAQILQQAGAAVLAQSNQQPRLALALLGG